MGHSIIWTIYKLLILLVCLLSMFFFPLREVPQAWIAFVVAITGFIMLTLCKISKSNKNTICILFLGLFYIYKMIVQGNVFQTIDFFVLLPIIIFNDDLKIDIYRFVSRGFAILLSISLIAWILFLLGYISTIGYSDFMGYNFITHPLFICDPGAGITLPRFHGLFLEPGHIGMICALFLYANHYKLKSFDNVVFILSIILSFSSAAYIITLLGYVFYLYSRYGIKKIWKKMLPFVMLLLLIIVINLDEDSVIYQLVFRKFIDVDSIIEENRYESAFISYYSNKMSDWNNYLFGISDFDSSKFPGNSGIKFFLCRIGLIGLLLVLWVSFTILKLHSCKSTILFFVLYVVSFIQRPYLEWYIMWIIFITSTPLLFSNKAHSYDTSI